MSVSSILARCPNPAGETIRVGLKTLADRRANGKTSTAGQEDALARVIAASGLSESDKDGLLKELRGPSSAFWKAPPLPLPPKAKAPPPAPKIDRTAETPGIDFSKMMGERPKPAPDDGRDILVLAGRVRLSGFRHEGPKKPPPKGDTLQIAREFGLAGLTSKGKQA